MKSLDEVIKAWEICHSDSGDCDTCPYCDNCEDSINDDVLYYLKMYRSDKLQYEAERKVWQGEFVDTLKSFQDARDRHIEALKELKRNDPLDWETLKTIEGKPVWVEMTKPDEIKDWFLICKVDDSFMWVADSKGDSHNFPLVCFDTNLWQAYRKERG